MSESRSVLSNVLKSSENRDAADLNFRYGPARFCRNTNSSDIDSYSTLAMSERDLSLKGRSPFCNTFWRAILRTTIDAVKITLGCFKVYAIQKKFRKYFSRHGQPCAKDASIGTLLPKDRVRSIDSENARCFVFSKSYSIDESDLPME